MSNIIYKEIDKEIERKIVTTFGDWVIKYGCLNYGNGCFTIAALYEDKVVGCAAVNPAQFIPPLDRYYDSFISLIEVDENYRRQGIGKHMIGVLEEESKEYGYRQIRAWSSVDKVEALNMWYSLNYCMCPAAMLGQSISPGNENKQIIGYYYAKMLNPAYAN